MHDGEIQVSRPVVALLALCCLFAGPARAQQLTADPILAVTPVGSVTLRVEQSPREEDMLDVGLVIFDPGIPIDQSSHSKLGIFPEIRKAEAQFMPVLLRQHGVDLAWIGLLKLLALPWLLKVLWADRDGLCLFAKRLERGRFVWPQASSGVVHLTPAQLSMLLEGIDWRRPERPWPPLHVS